MSGRGRGMAAVVLLVAGLCGCTADGPSPIGTAATPGTTPATSEPSTSSSGPAPPPLSLPTDLPEGEPGEVVVLAGDLELPWSIAAAPEQGPGAVGGWFFSLRDQARVVHLGQDGTTATVPTPEGETVPGTTPGGEGGLLGLAVLSQDSGTWLYCYQTVSVAGSTLNQVVRMPLTGNAPDALALGDPEPVVTGIPGAGRHNGGRLAFGPDKMLYVSTGDAGDTSLSQDQQSLGGKILRVTPTGEPAPGNPVAGSPVWSSGHRNVQGMGWDAQGRMFASEFGQDTFDELNLIEAGANYGWPVVEGSGGDPRYRDPLVTWATDAASPSGLAVTGDAVYLAALRGQRLWRVPLVDGPAVVAEPQAYLQNQHGRLRDVVLDGQDLLVLSSNAADDVVLRVSLR